MKILRHIIQTLRNTLNNRFNNTSNNTFKDCHLVHKMVKGTVPLLLILVSVTSSYAESMIPIGNPELEAPEVSAESAVLYSVDLEKALVSKNADKRQYPYSMTKLLTCFLAVENLDINQEVTISKSAADDIADGSTMGLEAGEKISVKDLLYGALLISGNDAAAALAEAVSGSENDFAELMNKTAEEWGCTNTHFVNASGVLDEQHYTSAEDFTIIAEHALADETIAGIIAEKKYTISKTNKHDARKITNLVLKGYGDIDGVVGGKTGTWDYGNASLVLSYKKDDLTAIIVLLKDSMPSRASDAKKLLEYASVATPGYIVAEEGDILGGIWVKHARRTRVNTMLSSDVRAYPADGATSSITTRIVADKVSAPLSRGDRVGTYEVYVGDKLVATRDLLIAEDVETGWLPSYAYISNRCTVVILSLIAILIFLLLLIRRRNIRRREQRRAEARRRKIEELARQ